MLQKFVIYNRKLFLTLKLYIYEKNQFLKKNKS